MTDSPFVRSGAVVRCGACDAKYRIKTSHIEREVVTGPRTLDETDAVLRSDSVDIDPDEVAPVSIDDEGNVVGLSGLSELMRFSDSAADAASSQDKLKARAAEIAGDDNAALPVAKPATPKTSKTKASKSGKAKKNKAKAGATPPESAPSASTGRERAQALRKKKKANTLILASLSMMTLLVLIGIVVMLMGDGEGGATNPTGDDPGSTAIAEGPDTTPKTNDPDASDADPSTPTTQPEVTLFDLPPEPSPNPSVAFVPPWSTGDASSPPADVPTVLTPAKPITFEGWYVMSPPRGSADAVGVTGVELSELTPNALGQEKTLLTGVVRNTNDRGVVRGELHVMLLDSTGRVFAETYTPLVMIEPEGEQAIALPIATRFWKRSRGTRAGVSVTDWSSAMQPMPGVQLSPVGQGEEAALRISAKHTGERRLRSALFLISATDAQGRSVERYFIDEDNLDVQPGDWLDLVVATPLPAGRSAETWSVVIQPR